MGELKEHFTPLRKRKSSHYLLKNKIQLISTRHLNNVKQISHVIKLMWVPVG